MIQQTLAVIESQQQRADNLAFLGVTKSAHNTISGPLAFDLLHRRALTAVVWNVQSLADHTIEIGAGALIPTPGFSKISGGRRESNPVRRFEVQLRELLQLFSPLLQRRCQQ